MSELVQNYLFDRGDGMKVSCWATSQGVAEVLMAERTGGAPHCLGVEPWTAPGGRHEEVASPVPAVPQAGGAVLATEVEEGAREVRQGP